MIEDLATQMTNLQKEIAQKTREYNRELMRALIRAEGKHKDIHDLTHNPLLKLSGRWDDLPDGKQELIARESPQIADFAEMASDARHYISPFMQTLSHPATRFVRGVLIPVGLEFYAVGKFLRSFTPVGFATTAGTTIAADVVWTLVQKTWL